MTSYSLPALGFPPTPFAGAWASLREGFEIEADLNTLAFQTTDAVEGMTAFLEKRKPVFRQLRQSPRELVLRCIQMNQSLPNRSCPAMCRASKETGKPCARSRGWLGLARPSPAKPGQARPETNE
jgi:hypothetical protein